MGLRGVSTSVIVAAVIIVALTLGAGYFFIVTQKPAPQGNIPSETSPTPTPTPTPTPPTPTPTPTPSPTPTPTPTLEEGEGVPPGAGPYYHQIYSATSTDGIHWSVDDTLLFDHASVPGAVYFKGKLYVYFVNAADPEHEKLSVGISEDGGVNFTVYDVSITGSNSPRPVDPNPIIDGDRIRLTYLGNLIPGSIGKIVTATSTDGINFEEDGVIFTGYVYDPDLFYDEKEEQWVLFLNPRRGLIKATAPSSTATFVEDPSFFWSEGSVSSTHRIGDKYYTYYAGMGGISVAEYSNGQLTKIAEGIVDGGDPTVVAFGPKDYKMFFKRIAGGGVPPGGGEGAVEFVNSTYAVAPGGTSGWFHTGQDADILLSGIDFNNSGGPLLFNHPSGIASDGTRLFLADTFNNRVLIWNTLPTGNVPPDIVLGQKDFTSNDPGTGRDQMNWPFGVATDGERLVVTDVNNARVLIWNSIPTENGAPADIVLGGGPTYWKSGDRRLPGSAWGVWTDGEKLAVCNTWDPMGGTVLIWNTFPTRDNQPANILLSGGGIGTPRHITSDGSCLIVGDHNARVEGKPETGSFFWKTFPTADNQPYDFYMAGSHSWWRGTFLDDGRLVLFGGDAPELRIWNAFPQNANDEADTVVRLETADLSGWDYEGMVVVGNSVYFSQGNLNRVIGYNSLPTQEDQEPDFIIGSPDINTNTLETNFFIQNGVPASNGESLFVVSDFDRKLYVWKHLPDQSGAYPDIVYNLPDQLGCIALFGETLALAGRDTICIWERLPLEGNPPDLTLQGGIVSTSFQDIRGVAIDNKYFYVADRGAGKIYVWEGLPRTSPKFALEIGDVGSLYSNGEYLLVVSGQEIKVYRVADLAPGTEPIASIGGHNLTNLPHSATASHGHLFIADTNFNRVLVWKNIEEAISGKWPPDVILGKKSLYDYQPGIGRNKLFLPAGICFDGSYLWVGEVKFSTRILRFSPSASDN